MMLFANTIVPLLFLLTASAVSVLGRNAPPPPSVTAAQGDDQLAWDACNEWLVEMEGERTQFGATKESGCKLLGNDSVVYTQVDTCQTCFQDICYWLSVRITFGADGRSTSFEMCFDDEICRVVEVGSVPCFREGSYDCTCSSDPGNCDVTCKNDVTFNICPDVVDDCHGGSPDNCTNSTTGPYADFVTFYKGSGMFGEVGTCRAENDYNTNQIIMFASFLLALSSIGCIAMYYHNRKKTNTNNDNAKSCEDDFGPDKA